MKLTRITHLFMRVDRQNWHFVQVETDEGITGIGEASLEGRELTVATAVDEFSRYLIGQDPGPIQHHWQRLHRHGFWRGGVILNSAISGIEQALWDIKGKKLGVPVYELLGGPTRQRVRLYTHCGGPSPEATVEHAVALVEQGYSALKFGTRLAGPTVDERAMIRLTAQMLERVREAVGPDIDMMLDNHGRMAPVHAIELMHAIAPVGLLFFEEAVPPDNIVALEKVSQVKANVPLATGERLFTKWEYRDLLERQIVDIIQPDICHAGGIDELRLISAMAETYYVKVAPHNPNGPVATAASVQFAATIPNFLILEMAQSQPYRDQAQAIGLKIEKGWVELPTRPGLGIELDYAAIAKYPYGQRDYRESYYPDGSVADI
ncbi:MAG TPA: galactonate dehydratase [Chloroflexota bacterium]|nr:galactonate dehydratase [Chloroflexota bacterium]